MRPSLSHYLLLMILFFLPCIAIAQTPPLPRDLPPYGPLVAFHAPQVTQKKLSNGLTVWLVPRPGFPKVALVVAVRGGRAADPKDRPGLSDLLLDTIDQGTKTRSARQIADEFQAVGGDLTGQPLSDSDTLSISFLSSRTEPALASLSDVLQNATFPDSQVALAKRNEQDALQAHEADPNFIAQRAFARAFFGDHPYSVISPTMESLASATPAEIREQFRKEFRPDQTVLVAVGDLQPAAFMTLVEKFFGQWTAPQDMPVESTQLPAQDNPHDVFVLARPHSVQTTFILGAFGPLERDPAFATTEVANAIYGGMFGSRLINDIREQKGYSYSPHSFLRLRKDATTLETMVNVRNEVTGACLNEILYQLNRMATTPPEKQEVERAKRYLVGTRAIAYQLQAAVARKLASLWVDGLPPKEIGQESEKIQKVTLEEVQAAGAKYFPAGRATIVAVGDENAIHQQLAPLGIPMKVVKP
jgi:zinc protease